MLHVRLRFSGNTAVKIANVKHDSAHPADVPAQFITTDDFALRADQMARATRACGFHETAKAFEEIGDAAIRIRRDGRISPAPLA
ncbi:hypothetical protein [Paracoccus sp. SJTW-4]|uniref:hypothetical protein n=1 Tax=Paracoccus sp. SJTW-4 TaxID=3078428 RepID=UPI0039E943D3